jgi:hypothetical protein
LAYKHAFDQISKTNSVQSLRKVLQKSTLKPLRKAFQSWLESKLESDLEMRAKKLYRHTLLLKAFASCIYSNSLRPSTLQRIALQALQKYRVRQKAKRLKEAKAERFRVRRTLVLCFWQIKEKYVVSRQDWAEEQKLVGKALEYRVLKLSSKVV